MPTPIKQNIPGQQPFIHWLKLKITAGLTRFSYFLKAAYIFFPGIIFLVLGWFIFLKLPQGKDIIYQSTDVAQSSFTGFYLVLAAIFWVFTTWYSARIIAYNRNDLFETAPWVLYHFPRLLGYSIFLVLWLAVFLIEDDEHKRNAAAWGIAAADYLIYIILYRFLEKRLQRLHKEPTSPLNNIVHPKGKHQFRTLKIIRDTVRIIIVICMILVAWRWQYKNVNILLWTIPVFQVGFLFLVIARRPVYETLAGDLKDQKQTTQKYYGKRFMQLVFTKAPDTFDLYFERTIFYIYNLLALFALICYLLSINYLPFARGLTSFPLVLLAFGIMLGVINFLSLLSYLYKINIPVLLIAAILLCGFVFEIHPVRLSKDKPVTAYSQRPGFRNYLENWITWHKDSIEAHDEYPVFFTLADGGASRSGYWVALVLSRLHEHSKYDRAGSYGSWFTEHLFGMSGASGGSVGNASFLTALSLQQHDPLLRTDSLSAGYLDNDFLSYTLVRYLGPEVVKPMFGWIKPWGDRAAALEISMDYPKDADSLMGKAVRSDFGRFIPDASNHFPVLCINTTRVKDGGPAVVSNIDIDKIDVKLTSKMADETSARSYRDSSRIFGSRTDVLRLVPPDRSMRISTAMVLGARFPYMSPGGRLGNDYFVDGGYFDNSGAGVVHEMLLELNRIATDSTDELYRWVKKLKYYVIHLSNTPYAVADPGRSIHPALNDLATPLITLAGSYGSQTSMNDARLINYLKELNKERNSYTVFNLYRDTPVVENIPMNWVISDTARTKMKNRVLAKPMMDTLIRRMRAGETQDLFKGFGKVN